MQHTDHGDYITEVSIFDTDEHDREAAFNLAWQFVEAGYVHPRQVRRDMVRYEERRRGNHRFVDQETGEVTYKRPGLSTAHIFPDINDFVPAHVEFYDNGDLVTVRRARIWCRYEDPKGGGKRGEVKSFSKASQRRLKRTLSKIDQSKRAPYFVTLTYPDEYPVSGTVWKRHLKNFWQRLERQYPKSAFFWVLELKRRKSGTNAGEFAPHFHLLVYGIPNLRDFIPWLSWNWYDVVGSGNENHLKAGTNVQLVRSMRRTAGYVSKALKYISKADVEDLPEDWQIGRFWGVYGRSNVPWAHRWICKLTDKEAIQLIRYLRRFARIKARDYRSLSVIADSNQWSDRIEDLLYPR